ncbi:MAG: transcriptional regulator [Kangiella sp.]|nr:MAG: transcriptional regulator [Kangiella sp.]PHS12259.1 MAG: transcriptional regulator [Kangiella sp.]PHS17125.1 MAG: transcriptional regulator [Kangiella sp.]
MVIRDLHLWLDMTIFTERLKLFRTERKITQARLAGLLEVDPRVYNRWERGLSTPQFETIIKIADILKVSIDELAGRKEPTNNIQLHNHELQSLYQQVDVLSDEDQQALILVIDSFVRKTHMARVVQKVR